MSQEATAKRDSCDPVSDRPQVGDKVLVPVKSAWKSKINWIAGLASLATVLNELLPLVPASWQHGVSVGIVVCSGVAVIATRTFATDSVTPGSLA